MYFKQNINRSYDERLSSWFLSLTFVSFIIFFFKTFLVDFGARVPFGPKFFLNVFSSAIQCHLLLIIFKSATSKLYAHLNPRLNHARMHPTRGLNVMGEVYWKRIRSGVAPSRLTEKLLLRNHRYYIRYIFWNLQYEIQPRLAMNWRF